MEMKLPDAVLKAAQRSSEIAQSLQNGKTPSQDDGITAPAAPQGQAQDTLPPKKPEDTQPPVDYEAKYLTLKGKYDAEVPRLNQTIRTLQDSQAQLVHEIETLKRTTPETKNEPATGIDSVDFVKLGEYGEDFGKLGAVIEDLNRKLSDTQRELSATKAQLGNVSETQQVTEQQARTQYMSSVRAGVARLGGDFDTLNTDPGFLNFLRQYPEGENQSRLAMLNQYEIYLNLDGALGFFKEYLSSKSHVQREPAANKLPNVQPTSLPPGTDVNLGIPTSTKTWTRKEISQFYIDKSKGKYKGREEECRKLELDIFQAPTQGRVTA